MFTGIVEEMGKVLNVTETGGDLRLKIGAKKVLDDLNIGDSVSVSGCCLTAVAKDADGFEVELSKETVQKTTPRWQQGKSVNLERAMRLSDRLGGHIVSGHVEATGTVMSVVAEPGAYVLTVRAAQNLAKYLIPKGSITVDGVSLTLVDVGGPGGSSPALGPNEFTLWLIPHTLSVTTLGELQPGDTVNLEADLVAKYVERLTLLNRDNKAGEKEVEHVR